MEFSAGDVVLVPFPYRDRLAERARPAIVISDGVRLDVNRRMMGCTWSSNELPMVLG